MKEYILEVRKIIPKFLCKKIITYFDNEYEDAGTLGGTDKNIRNCLTRTLLDPKSFGQKLCTAATQEKIYECVQHNKHDAGYKFHTDFGLKVQERHLSISICLNNEYSGGEFVFNLPTGKHVVPQNEGDAVIFPSNFMFSHQVNKVSEGTRYALIGWVI